MKYLKEHEIFLKKHGATPRKELAGLFNGKFNTEISHKALSQKCRKLGLVCPNNGCFKKGSIPVNKGKRGIMKANKTSFRPGNIPKQTKRVGTISKIKDKNGSLYMYIKIAEPNKWRMLHLYIYEHKHGKVPEGHCVIFKDKNTLNTRLDNLMLVSRAELARLNQKYANIDGRLKETALQVIKISTEARKRNK